MIVLTMSTAAGRLARLLILTAIGFALLACNREPAAPLTEAESRPNGVITLGDIDPDEPATRVRRIQPLANLLAKRLQAHDIGRGRVSVARDIAEMAAMLANGEVGLFLDSPYPILAVNREAGSRVLMLRQAKNDAEYWAEFIALNESGFDGLDDIAGEVVVFQEPHSTSGFLLPAMHLMDAGYALRSVGRLDGIGLAENEIGCHFSGDEENTIELVLSGRAKVGAISNQDFRELPPDVQQRLIRIGRTISVPRQLVAVRPRLDPSLTDSIRGTLLALTDEDRENMAAQDAPRGWTWEFEEPSEEVAEQLRQLEARMASLPTCAALR